MSPISSALLAGQLIRLQMGAESAWGTKHAATALLMGATPTPKITPLVKETAFAHQLGTLEPSFVHAKLQSGGAFTIPGTVTYEEAMILLGWALGTVTPTGSYTWSNASPLSTVPNVQPYTLELGNMGDGANTDDVVLTGCLPETLKISGEIGKELTFEVAGFGQQFNTGVQLTGSINYKSPVPEPVLFLGSTFSMDPLGTAAGTTPWTQALAKFSLEITTGMSAVSTADQRYPTAWTHKATAAKLSLTLLLNHALRGFITTNLMIDSAGGNQIGAAIRFKAISGAKSFQFDFAGVMDTDPGLFDSEQEVQAITVPLSAMYDSTMANHLKTVVVNTVATLP
jgi:hypothetical protein